MTMQPMDFRRRRWTQADMNEAMAELTRLDAYIAARMQEQADFGHPNETPRDQEYQRANTRILDLLAVAESHLPDVGE